MNKHRKLKFVLWLIAITGLCTILAFPLFWMISTSLKPQNEIFSSIPTFIPRNITFNSYARVWGRASFFGYMKNSFMIAGATTLFAVTFASLSGYAFSRMYFRGRKVLLYGVLSAQMFPGAVLLIPIFIVMKSLNLINTYVGLILAYITFSLPFCTWMMRGFFDSIPKSLEQAAMIDGCNRIQAFVRVVLPLSLPGVVTTFIFSFMTAWDEMMFALNLTSSESMRTIPIGLYNFIGQFGTEWDVLMAASVITTIPALLIFAFLQKYLIKGLTAGAVKG